MTDTQTRVVAIIGQEIVGLFGQAREVALDDELVADLEASPIDRCCISVEIDEQFLIDLTDAEIEGWVTVRDVVASVETKLAHRVASA